MVGRTPEADKRLRVLKGGVENVPPHRVGTGVRSQKSASAIQRICQIQGVRCKPYRAQIRTVQPRDELEAMLAVQMGAIHQATMMMARRLNHVKTIPQQDAAERSLNKLARTYTTQMEALKRYRTGGQQRVTVEHVTVNAGGQAIVGAVAHRKEKQ
jgi:hypothetical protein